MKGLPSMPYQPGMMCYFPLKKWKIWRLFFHQQSKNFQSANLQLPTYSNKIPIRYHTRFQTDSANRGQRFALILPKCMQHLHVPINEAHCGKYSSRVLAVPLKHVVKYNFNFLLFFILGQVDSIYQGNKLRMCLS